MKGKLTCGHNDIGFDANLLKIILTIEGRLNCNFNITSGVRCEKCNKDAGGRPTSAHLTGNAVDIECPDDKTRFKIVYEAINLGINRIGLGKNFVHIDNDKTKTKEVLWLY